MNKVPGEYELMNEIIESQEKLLADSLADLEMAMKTGKTYLVDTIRFTIETNKKTLAGLKQARAKALIEAGIWTEEDLIEEESFKRR